MKQGKKLLIQLSILILLPANLLATELGFFLHLSPAEIDATSRTGKVKFDAPHYGAGLVLDKSLLKHGKVFYRLNLGYEYLKITANPEKIIEFSENIVSDQTLAYSLINNDYFQFWLGPRLRLSISGGKSLGRDDFDIIIWGIGIGPAVGANISIGKTVILSLSTGSRYTRYDTVSHKYARAPFTFITGDERLKLLFYEVSIFFVFDK